MQKIYVKLLSALLVWAGFLATNQVMARMVDVEADWVKITAAKQVIKANPNDVQAYLNMGAALEDLGQTYARDAGVAYTRAIELNPASYKAYMLRASLRARSQYGVNGIAGLDDDAGSLADYNKAIELQPDMAEAYFERANLVYRHLTYDYLVKKSTPIQAGDYQGALSDCRKAVQLDSKRFDFFALCGQIEYEIHDYQAALADLNQAIALQSPYPYSVNELRALTKYALGDFTGAIADYDRAIASMPNWPNYYIERAQAKRALGDMAGAKADERKAKKAERDFMK